MLRKTAIAGALALGVASPAYAQSALEWSVSQPMQAHSPPVSVARSRGIPRPRLSAPLEIRSPSQILATAQTYLGRGKMTPYAGPWCRDWINLIARRSGIHLANNSRRAIDAVGLGRRVANPQPGDLVVMKHHVTIYAGHEGGKIVGLGGNQGRKVRYSHYDPRRVVAFVRL